MKTPLLGDRAFYKRAAMIGIPIALQNLLTTSGSIVDTIMIGSLGELAVAGVGICAQFASLLIYAIYGFFSGGIIFYTQYWGIKNEEGIGKAYSLTLSCMLLFGLLFGFVAIFAPEWILSIYTDKTAIREIAVPYLRILGVGFPLQILAFAASGLLRSTEQVRLPLYASIASLFTNMFLNWVLIFGKLGFPAMGVQGAAIATVAGNAVNVIVIYAYCLWVRHRAFILAFRSFFRWDREFLKEYFSKSVFLLANEGFMGAGLMIINIVTGRQNEMAIAALAVFRVIEQIVMSFFRGFSSASAVMVGMEIGAGRHMNGYTYAKRFAVICPVFVFVVCVIQFLLRTPLLSAFGLGAEAMEYGQQMLLIFIACATARCCNWICNDNFRAGGESRFGALIEIVCMYAFTIPSMLLAGLVFKLPFAVVFICMYMDDFVRVGLVIWYMRAGKWVKPVTEEGKRAIPAFRELLSKR